jgi:methylglutaconyl-CoA hydratase
VPESVNAFLKDLRGTFTRLSTLPIPTISAIGSTAFGGGLEIALCTNFRVLASTATVGLPETRLAIIPGAGGTYRLPAIIGPSRARDLILTGRRVTGPEAYFLGLADRLVEITEEQQGASGVARGLVLEQAVDMARVICEGGPVAIRAAMQAVNGWEKGERSENAAYDMVIPTEDRTEALKAFGEKRKPVFKGR